MIEARAGTYRLGEVLGHDLSVSISGVAILPVLLPLSGGRGSVTLDVLTVVGFLTLHCGDYVTLKEIK
jgi:hypothetical protein